MECQAFTRELGVQKTVLPLKTLLGMLVVIARKKVTVQVVLREAATGQNS